MCAWVFTASPQYAEQAEGLRMLLLMPVDLAELMATVGRLLEARDPPN
jgi:hypothetical protein